MYDLLLSGLRDYLQGLGLFGSVQCGLGRPTAYPAAMLWLQKSTDGEGRRDPVEHETVVLQIQGYADDDTEQSYLEMLGLIRQAKTALHEHRIGGAGQKTMQVAGVEAARMESGGPTIYLLTLTVAVTPSNFSLT